MANSDRQYDILYRTYQALSMGFPGWSLSDIKDMAVREREYWLDVIKHRQEMQRWQAMTQPTKG